MVGNAERGPDQGISGASSPTEVKERWGEEKVGAMRSESPKRLRRWMKRGERENEHEKAMVGESKRERERERTGKGSKLYHKE